MPLRPRAEYEAHLAQLGTSCAFCTMSRELDIADYSHWKLVYAAFPYRRYHTLLVSKEHVRSFSEIKPGALAELALLTKEVERIYRDSGVLKQRSTEGDQLFFSWRNRNENEGQKESVRHFHLHIYPENSEELAITLHDKPWTIDLGVLRP